MGNMIFYIIYDNIVECNYIQYKIIVCNIVEIHAMTYQNRRIKLKEDVRLTRP